MFTVLLTGILLVSVVLLIQREPIDFSGIVVTHSGISGVAFAFGFWALYKAFEIGPVRLVAPIIAGFPVLTVGWATINGTPVTKLQWFAVLAVIFGISVVTILSKSKSGHDRRFNAIFLSIISAFSFAIAFISGQSASFHGADFTVLALVRIAALLCVCFFSILGRESIRPDISVLPILVVMGILDTFALGAVLIASSFSNPEYAAVSASTSGLFTIYLAKLWLKESISLGQWGGVLICFCGIGYLAL